MTGEFIGTVSKWNSYFSGGVVVVACSAMVGAALYTKTLLPVYRYQMLLSAFICFTYTILNMFTNPTIAVVFDEDTVLIIKSGIATEYLTGLWLMVVFFILVMITAVHPMIQFCHRYLAIVHSTRRHYWEHKWVWSSALVPFGLALSAALFFCYESWPNSTEYERFNLTVIAISELAENAFLVATIRVITDPILPIDSFELDPFSYAAIIFVFIVVVISLSTIVFCAFSISSSLRLAALSPKTKEMQRQLSYTLIIQAIIPFVTIHIPLNMCCLLPMLNFDIGPVTEYLTFLLSYYPVFLPITAVYYCKDVRKRFISTVTKSTTTKSTTTERTMFTLTRKWK